MENFQLGVIKRHATKSYGQLRCNSTYCWTRH